VGSPEKNNKIKNSKIGLIFKKLLPNIIEAVILTGYGAGETVLIPCIPLIPTDYSF